MLNCWKCWWNKVDMLAAVLQNLSLRSWCEKIWRTVPSHGWVRTDASALITLSSAFGPVSTLPHTGKNINPWAWHLWWKKFFFIIMSFCLRYWLCVGVDSRQSLRSPTMMEVEVSIIISLPTFFMSLVVCWKQSTDFLAVRFLGCQISWLSDFLAVRLLGCQISWLSHFLAVTFLGCHISRMSHFLVVIFLGYQISWLSF